MKQLLLKTPAGRFALSLRDHFTLLRAAMANQEALGTLSNDILAGTLVASICRPDTTFIDVGAHIGSVMTEVRARSPSTRLIAFEAIPEKAAALRQSFPDAQIHSCALGDSTGETSFFIDTRRSGYSGLSKSTGTGEPDAVLEIRVPIARLDDMVAASDVDVIKIDVEGAELGVLRGAAQIVSRCRPVVMFESAPPSDDGLGYSKEAMHTFFEANGYSLRIPNRLAHDGPGLGLDGFLESHCYPRRCTNYFAVPAERVTEIRDRARRALNIRLS